MLKKAKLIWTERGYRVEHCRWHGYIPSTWKTYLVHDLFEHRPEDVGTVKDEVRAVGAKLRFDGVYTFFDKADGQHYFENRKIYKRTKYYTNIQYHKKGKAGLSQLAKTYKHFGHYQTVLKLVTEGYKHATQFSEKAYLKAYTINWERYHKQKVDLEISLVTGRILKKLPKTY